MSSMTFLINDSSTGGNTPVVQIVITQNADGTVTFAVTQLAGYVGDLRGLFFDVADETLIGTLSATAAANLTEFQQGNDSITDLGNGANMQGLLGDAGGYDVGVEIGTAGLKTSDDVRTFTFTLDSSSRDLTLADFSNVAFGARITSVGLDSNLDGTFETSRSGSSKTGEVTFAVITPTKDCATVSEDATQSGNVLANDGAGAGDVLTVTGWSGGALGTQYAFVELNHAKIQLDANGSYSIDASAADALGEGESVTHTFTYDVLQTNAEGTSSHTVSFKVTITGTNDAPVIAGELFAGGVTEAGSNADVGTLSTSDTFAFDDADLTDDHSVSFAPVGTTLGTLSALSISDPATGAGDGTVSWTYSVSAADVAYLAEDETLVEEFTVTVTDDAGTPLSDSATVRVTITGTNDAPIVAAVDVTGAVTEQGTPAGDLTDSGTIAFSDVDLADVHSVGPVAPSAGALGTLTASVSAQASDVDGTGGVITWNYALAASAVEYLAKDETRVESFTFTLSDGHGGTVDRTVQVTITGTNDAPDLQVVTTDSAAVTLPETDAGLTASRTLTVTDVDTIDVISSSVSSVVASGTTSGLVLTNAQLLAMMSVAPTAGLAANTGDTHNLTWTFDSGAQAFDYLNSGQSLVLTYTIASSDGQGGNDTQQVTVTIDGAADGPTDIVLTGIAPGQTNIPNGALGQLSAVGASGPVTFGATLVEKDLLGATQSDATPDITVSSSGLVSGVSGPNGIQEGRIYELAVTATDSGGSATELLRVVTGTTGGETINLGATNEDLVFLASGNDTIFSGAGDDTVYGQSGTDRIHGGEGNDVLFGMNGTDTFYFDTALDAATNVDTIRDFNANNGNPNADTLFLSTAVFAGIGSGSGTLAAADYASVSSGGTGDVSALSVGASVNIVFDSSTGGLFYDANGGSLADATKFAVVDLAGLTGTFNNGDIEFGA